MGEDALHDAFDEYLRQRSQTTAKVAVTDGAALPAACRSTLLGCAVHCIALHLLHLDPLLLLLLLQVPYLISWSS